MLQTFLAERHSANQYYHPETARRPRRAASELMWEELSLCLVCETCDYTVSPLGPVRSQRALHAIKDIERRHTLTHHSPEYWRFSMTIIDESVGTGGGGTCPTESEFHIRLYSTPGASHGLRTAETTRWRSAEVAPPNS